MSDADFIKEYGTRARNLGFHSLTSTAAPTMRNTLKVVVDRTTTLKEGDNVVLRLLESAKVQGLRIPRPVSYTHLDVYKRQLSRKAR